MKYETIIFTVENGVASIQMNRPETMNAINDALVQEITAAMDEAEKETSVGALVITGREGFFSAGADLKFTQGLLSKNPAEAMEFILGSRKFFDRIASFSRPTMAAINGRAFGGGLEIGLACDFRLAVAGATLGLPEINIGAVPLGGGTQRLPRVVGASRAKQMMMTGQIVTAEEALKMGLVNAVFTADDFAKEVRTFAQGLCRRAPLAIRTVKALVDSGIEMNLTAGLDMENETVAKILGSEDCKEGINAYLNKRKPEFKGR
jgi:enoyl-CoA hydratase